MLGAFNSQKLGSKKDLPYFPRFILRGQSNMLLYGTDGVDKSTFPLDLKLSSISRFVVLSNGRNSVVWVFKWGRRHWPKAPK